MLDLDALHALSDRDDGADRAFADANVRMRWARGPGPEERAELRRLHRTVQAAALRSHAEVRERIADGRLRGERLREHFDAVPALERDHHVEEVLGIAYPPLEELAPERELIAYCPSGYDEIVHAFDVTALAAGDRLLDIGAGAGKVTLLARLLHGASCAGVERDGSLVELALGAAHALGLPPPAIEHGDAREVVPPPADVVFMYLPFTGSALAGVLERLRGRFLCAAALDLERHPELVIAGPSRSWLHVYAWRGVRAEERRG